MEVKLFSFLSDATSFWNYTLLILVGITKDFWRHHKTCFMSGSSSNSTCLPYQLFRLTLITPSTEVLKRKLGNKMSHPLDIRMIIDWKKIFNWLLCSNFIFRSVSWPVTSADKFDCRAQWKACAMVRREEGSSRAAVFFTHVHTATLHRENAYTGLQ